MLSFTRLSIFSIYIISLCLAGDLPSYFPRCHIDDPELGKCLIKATETVRQHIKKGVPELNIPPIDPLVIPEITLQQGTNAVNYKLRLVNAVVKGTGDYDFTEFAHDPKTLTFHGTVFFKEMLIVSDYEIDGKVLLAPITGKGSMTIQLESVTASLIIKGELIERDGEEYINIVDVKVTIAFVKSLVNFSGLFNGNEELSQATNKLINDNSQEILTEISPALEEVVAALVKRMMEGISTKVPYKKILPPSH